MYLNSNNNHKVYKLKKRKISMEDTQIGEPRIKGLLRLAEGSFTGRLDSTETLRILERTRQEQRLSNYSLLNIAIIPAGSDKYEYLVYANLPGAPLPLNYQDQKGLIHFVGGRVLWPAIEAPKTSRTNRQEFEALFAPAPEQYRDDTSSPREIEYDTREIQHTVSLRNKHRYSK